MLLRILCVLSVAFVQMCHCAFWSRFDDLPGRVYGIDSFSGSEAGYDAAKAECRVYGSHLLSINSETEYNSVLNEFDRCWIGLACDVATQGHLCFEGHFTL